MKISVLLCSAVSLATSATAFAPTLQSRPLSRHFMFDGAGSAAPKEDNPEEQQKIEAAAKAMGMSVEEYQLGMNARSRLVEDLNAARLTGGNPDKVSVNRDGNNPPNFLEVSITDAGKALGKEALSAELCAALKTASDESRTKRANAQKDMMAYIGDEMKKLGK